MKPNYSGRKSWNHRWTAYGHRSFHSIAHDVNDILRDANGPQFDEAIYMCKMEIRKLKARKTRTENYTARWRFDQCDQEELDRAKELIPIIEQLKEMHNSYDALLQTVYVDGVDRIG